MIDAILKVIGDRANAYHEDLSTSVSSQESDTISKELIEADLTSRIEELESLYRELEQLKF